MSATRLEHVFHSLALTQTYHPLSRHPGVKHHHWQLSRVHRTGVIFVTNFFPFQLSSSIPLLLQLQAYDLVHWKQENTRMCKAVVLHDQEWNNNFTMLVHIHKSINGYNYICDKNTNQHDHLKKTKLKNLHYLKIHKVDACL